MRKKKKRDRFTIEGQLESYYLDDKRTERNEILWHAWCQNKRWLSQLLETTLSSFPTFSKHDESHARTVLHNIEMILGEKRVKELSASDCFMLLHTVYIHDIGMVITYEDREEIVQNEEFIEMVKLMEDNNDPVFQRAIRALQQKEYSYDDEDSKVIQTQKLYSDKLAVYYAILHLISTFRRTEHGSLSDERLTEWTLKSEKLGAGFSMAGIPQRIFLWIAKCAGLHTDYEFRHIMALPPEDNGYASDYVHPRFVAVLLQLGDILDMDNDRFYPLTKECIGTMPEMSERHYEKHQSIRRLYIKPDVISIEADCSTQEALRLVRKECDMLKDILKEAGYNWSQICPKDFSGALPTIESVKLYLNGTQIPEELVATQFRITQQKAFSILEGSNVYEGQFVFLREFLQNAIDASKIQYWNECIRTRGYYKSKDEMRIMSPDHLEGILSTDIFPIEIEMQIVKRDEDKNIFSIEQKDVDRLLKKKKNLIDEENEEQSKKEKKIDWQYGVKVRIKDFGTGIDKESIKNIANVGNSRRKDRSTISEMPEWLKPTAEFGIGLQSAFLLTNMFKCYTYTRSNEKYEITFSTVKSNYYEGYINVHPIKKFNSKDDAYGTCFEVFVPFQKKLKHELYPLAWDGKDYFDEDYEALRPLRHSAELLAQMALYLDGMVGEQMFPIHLNVIPNDFVAIPLNTSDKNKIRNLKYKLVGKAEGDSDLKEDILSEWDKEDAGRIKEIFQKRIWHENGKSWIYYYDRYKEEDQTIILERTDKAVALLDNRDGHLYYWDNELCTFGLINMENFLLLERQKTENRDKHCENAINKVRLYYKGIELDEKELPGIGNELFQYIDIKGKLEREYVNLSRKGFTEEGEIYFLQQIYYPLLESIQKMLDIINKKHSKEVVEGIKYALDTKREAMVSLSDKIEKITKNGKLDVVSESREVQGRGLLGQLMEMRKKLIMMYKEHVISVTMLSFFAQKDYLDLITQIGTEKTSEESNCWKEIIELVKNYRINQKNEESTSEKAREDSVLEKSVLFHIEHRPQVNLLRQGWKEANLSGVITFPEIFSEKMQFMIVSKREEQSAPWKQYLIPIWRMRDSKEESIIDLLRRYFTMDSRSNKKENLREKIFEMGKNALKVAMNYGINAYGESGAMSPGEYLQQYFLKWLLMYIPTVALFMSEDGNVRVNIIHNQIFPFVFMNDAAKKLIVNRIIEDTKRYGIQRFSIPAWQGLEYLSCGELPYSHYFVKRGYLSEESYSKIIFPFDGDELLAISDRINSQENMEKIKYLTELFGLLNIRKQLIEMVPEMNHEIEEMICNIRSEGKRELLKQAYRDFRADIYEKGYSKILDRVRVNYRQTIAGMIKNLQEDTAELSDYKEVVSNLNKNKRVYLYFLLLTISVEYRLEISRSEFPVSKKSLEEIAKIWKHIIEKQYLQNASEVVKYRKEYLRQMELGKGTAFMKRERILSFIERNRRDGMRGEFLAVCWMQYVKEIFRLFEMVEADQFSILDELLPDKADIERGTYLRDREGTEDADN